MRFWDSSAIVPLLAQQPATTQSERWLDQDGQLVVWTFSETEIRSALWRLLRERLLDEEQTLACERLSEKLLLSAHVIHHVEEVKKHARRLLRVHPLRAADALQLGAAITWADGSNEAKVFHAFDLKLRDAARREGFSVD